MPQPILTFDVMGDVQLSRGLSRFADDVKDLREPFREIVKQFHKIEKQQFDSEGGYGSGGWTPLSPATIEQKARVGFPDKILVRTGALRNSLVGETGESEIEIRPLQMRKRVKLRYAIYHQTSTSRMPARPLIQLTEKDKMDFMKTIQRYLVKQAKERL